MTSVIIRIPTTLLALKDFLCSVFRLNENIHGFQGTDQE